MGTVDLGLLDLALAAGLVVLAGALSLALGLQLERRLAWAATRTVVQLLLVGQILRWVFTRNAPSFVVLVGAIMLAVAGRAAIRRPSRTFRGAYPLALFAMATSAVFVTAVVTQLVIRIDPWYRPQYVVPLLGLLLGNSLTGLSLGIDAFLESLEVHRRSIEADLALGATRWEAARDPVREAVRRALIPILNTMSVAGLVSLPGIMTGQILAGADPVVAVEYQIVVMFMIAASTALSSMVMVLLVYRRAFTAEHRLRRDFVTRR